MRHFSIIILFLACMAVATLHAQTVPETLHGFSSGSKTENHISAIIGLPFDAEFSGGGFEVSEGLLQAQLEKMLSEVTVNYGDGYTDDDFTFASDISAGTYKRSLYKLGGAEYGYDLLRKLLLKVVKFVNCGDTILDVDNNPYPTVEVADHCWTKQNLKPTHFPDGTSEIPDAMAYQSSMHPDADANVATYGRLYTWASAVNANADGTLTPDANGYVQGICPDGWHIPTATEMAALKALPVEDIRSTELWVATSANTNITDFTALPAGKYNGALTRYEGLGTQTDWWSMADDPTATTPPASLSVVYYCGEAIDGNPTAADGLSVRCVKNE